MTDRCEPPAGLRDKSGRHWLTFGGDVPEIGWWVHEAQAWNMDTGDGYDSPAGASLIGYRYVAPVASPNDVARLVQASADALSLLADMVLIASPDISRSDIADVGAELETSLAPFTRMAETPSAAPQPITTGCEDDATQSPATSPNGVGV